MPRTCCITHLIATRFHGGPEKQVIEHLRRLRGTEYRGILVSFLEDQKANETLQEAEAAGIPHYGIPMANPFDIRAWRRLREIVVPSRTDILCTHGYKSAVMGWWLGRKAKIPVLSFSRGYTTENLKVAFYEWLERQALKRATGIIFVSEGHRKRMGSLGIRGRRNWVVYNAASVAPNPNGGPPGWRENVARKLNISPKDRLVVSAGRLSPEKGHRFLVEAIHRLGRKADGTSFVFCGEGECQRDLEQQAQALGVSHCCHFVGFRRDLQEIFQVMDLFVLPSLTEGFPNVVLEAFAWAKPVVATSVGGVPELVENGVNGLLVAPGRPDLLAEAMGKCLAIPEIMETMGKAGFQKVKAEFTFERQTDKLKEIYQEILRTGAS